MKLLKTKKWIKENYVHIFTVGYGDLQILLGYQQPDFYSTRVEGWACDYYVIDEKNIISTGYSPIEQENISRHLIDMYEQEAKELSHNSNISFESKQQQIEALKEKFFDEIKHYSKDVEQIRLYKTVNKTSYLCFGTTDQATIRRQLLDCFIGLANVKIKKNYKYGEHGEHVVDVIVSECNGSYTRKFINIKI